MKNNARTRLLVSSSTYPRWRDDYEPGFVHALSLRLADSFDVCVVCPHDPGAKKVEVLDGVEVNRYSYGATIFGSLVFGGGILQNIKRNPLKLLVVPIFLFAQACHLRKKMKEFKPDLVHIHWIIPQGIVYLLVRRLMGSKTPFVVTSHGADLYAFKKGFLGFLKRWVLSNADAITVVSEPMRDIVTKLVVCGRKIHVIPMGVDLSEAFTAKEGANEGRGNTVLFVGRLVEKKGCVFLLEAMADVVKYCPDAILRIVGDGPERERLENRAQSLGIRRNAEFFGGVPSRELPCIYRSSSVFVAPFIEASSGDREGLGLVLIEALGCGCKVVVTDMEASKDVYRGLNCVKVVPQKDIGSLSKAIIEQLRGGRQISQSEREVLEQRFGWEGVSERYRELLRSLAPPDPQVGDSA